MGYEKEMTARASVKTPIKWVKRDAWGAAPPRSKEPLPIPVKAILLMDTSTEECFDRDHCDRIVQGLQKKFMEEKNFDDIPWSYLVAGDGHVYEGRGWKWKTFKPDLSNPRQAQYDGTSLDIAYIGNFESEIPPGDYFKRSAEVIDYALENEYISDDTAFESFLSEYKFKQ